MSLEKTGRSQCWPSVAQHFPSVKHWFRAHSNATHDALCATANEVEWLPRLDDILPLGQHTGNAMDVTGLPDFSPKGA